MGWRGGIVALWDGTPSMQLLIRVHFCDLRPISVTPNGEEEPRGRDYRDWDWDDGVRNGIMGL